MVTIRGIVFLSEREQGIKSLKHFLYVIYRAIDASW